MNDYYEGKFDKKPMSLLSIKEHRKKRGMSQLELSQATHLFVPQNVISELETGQRRLTNYTLPHLCNVFEVAKEDLIIGNNLALEGIKLEDRFRAVKAVLDDSDLFIASKGIARAEKLDKKCDIYTALDRDSWGVKLTPEQVEARKSDDHLTVERDSFGRPRTKEQIKFLRKEAKKKRAEKDLDFGNRNGFGRKIAKKTIVDESALDDILKDKESSFEEKLRALIMKGKLGKGLE